MQRVVLVRHGQTEWSADGRHTGRTDVPLTAEGRRQAEALRTCLGGWSFELVLTSPMQRARDTVTLALPSAEAAVREDLREWDYGRYEGRTTAQIRERVAGWNLWTNGVPGGEAGADVGERADRIIAEIRAKVGDAAVFGHGHALRVLAARWVGMPWSAGGSFTLDTASLSVLGYERETPVLIHWNEGCHDHGGQ